MISAEFGAMVMMRWGMTWDSSCDPTTTNGFGNNCRKSMDKYVHRRNAQIFPITCRRFGSPWVLMTESYGRRTKLPMIEYVLEGFFGVRLAGSGFRRRRPLPDPDLDRDGTDRLGAMVRIYTRQKS